MGRHRDPTPRVLGPYADGPRGWQYTIVDGGRKTRRRCRPGCSEAEARIEVEAARAALEAAETVLSVDDAVKAYVKHLTDAGDSEATATWAEGALASVVQEAGHLPIGALTARHAAGVLKRNAATRPKAGAHRKGDCTPSLSSQQSYWASFRRACAWWVKRGWCKASPVEAFEKRLEARDEALPWATPAGARALGRGKAQLRNEQEALAYLEQALAGNSPTHRVAAALPLLTGICSGELLHLQVGDVDLVGGAIWVQDEDKDGWTVKRDSRRRSLPLPSALRADLEQLCAGKKASEWLLVPTKGEPRVMGPQWLEWLVQRVCLAAKVRVVSPHGLRGTYSTLLAERQRRSMAEIASALGHKDKGSTAERHYVAGAEVKPELRLVQAVQAVQTDKKAG